LKHLFDDRRILVTGGTGSLGRALVRRLLSGSHGTPRRVVVFSRDERKQHAMRLAFAQLSAATEEVIYADHAGRLAFVLGDVRDAASVTSTLRGIDVVFHLAALKQVPTCEYHPYEAVRTNVEGAHNIVQAIRSLKLPVEAVVAISTDKACEPISLMGMTKAIQERIFINANVEAPETRFVCVRYGNVLASRGSVIPLFRSQIASGRPVTVTTPDMTRFLLSLETAADAICAAYAGAEPGETWVPVVPASKIVHVARALIGDRDVEIQFVGIRPGEKVHEVLVAEVEAHRTLRRGDYYVIRPLLPELGGARVASPALQAEYSSRQEVMDLESTRRLLERSGLTGSAPLEDGFLAED
jgi:UDP-glucose 4-epimerase